MVTGYGSNTFGGLPRWLAMVRLRYNRIEIGTEMPPNLAGFQPV